MELANPAPGQLELVRTFINTLDIEAGFESLKEPADLGGWLAERGLLPPGEAVDPADLELALELRESLRELAQANAGQAESREALAHLEDCCQDLHVHLRVKLGGAQPLSLEPDDKGARGALGRLLVIVFEATLDGSWARLKVCDNETCRWAFYDRSRNHSGRWCDMSACGNVVKMRNYRRRASAAAS